MLQLLQNNVDITNQALLSVTKNWKRMLPSGIIKQIKILDELWDKEGNLVIEDANAMSDTLASIEKQYNEFVIFYNSNLNKPANEIDVRVTRETFYFLRDYIQEQRDLIIPSSDRKITIGNLHDDLKIIDFTP